MMISLTLKSFFRSLTNSPGYSALSIGGLALGIAAFILLTLYVRFENSYESWFKDSDEIYLVQMNLTLPGSPEATYPNTMGGLLEQMKGENDKLVGTRIKPAEAIIKSGDRVQREPIGLVDKQFFRVFPWELIRGDAATALNRPDSLVITETIAERYFKGDDAVGQSLSFVVNGETSTHRVTGIIADIPSNSAFSLASDGDTRISMLMPLPRSSASGANWYNWGSAELYTYLRFATPKLAAEYAEGLAAFTDRHAESDGDAKFSDIMKFSLLPIRAWHLNEPSDRNSIITLAIIGLLTLLIAIINYVNMATARAGLRAREVAMRKVLGASQSQLLKQFMGESMLTVAMATLVGLALVELSLPFINASIGSTLQLNYLGSNGLLVPIIVFAVVTGFLAGLYPALFLAKFQPSVVLASAKTPAGGRIGIIVRETLVVMQFAIAIGFGVGATVLLAQASHMRTADLGFNRDGLMIVTSFRDDNLTNAQRSSLLSAFGSINGVDSITNSDSAPADFGTISQRSMFRPDGIKPDPTLSVVNTGPDYFRTYDTKLIAGRFLDKKYGGDDLSAEGQSNVVVNTSAARSLGYKDPAKIIGKSVRDSERSNMVVGVVADFRFLSPREPIPPTMYFMINDGLESPVAAIRYVDSAPDVVKSRLQQTWRGIAPDTPFDATTANNNIAKSFYEADESRAQLFALGTGLAIVIACIGLYGLSAFNAAQRTREIGIRKTLGASAIDIAKLLLTRSMRSVLIANLVAWPLAFIALRAWLSGFDDRISLNLLHFVGPSIVAILISAGTIAFLVVKTARADPAKALREE